MARSAASREIRSAFLMTEPEVASSERPTIRCRIERNGNDYVVNGRNGGHRERAIRAANSS